jgi:hypothetical protein
MPPITSRKRIFPTVPAVRVGVKPPSRVELKTMFAPPAWKLSVVTAEIFPVRVVAEL